MLQRLPRCLRVFVFVATVFSCWSATAEAQMIQYEQWSAACGLTACSLEDVPGGTLFHLTAGALNPNANQMDFVRPFRILATEPGQTTVQTSILIHADVDSPGGYCCGAAVELWQGRTKGVELTPFGVRIGTCDTSFGPCQMVLGSPNAFVGSGSSDAAYPVTLSVDVPYFIIYRLAAATPPATPTPQLHVRLWFGLPLLITTSELPTAALGQIYPVFTIAFTGGTGPFSWSMEGLPPGMFWTSNMISGVPTLGGVYNVTVTVRDTATGAAHQRVLPLRVGSCSAITNTNAVLLPYQGNGAGFTVTIGNGSPNHCEYSIDSGYLYPALRFADSTGADAGRGSVAPGGHLQLSVNISSLIENPYCAARTVRIRIFTQDAVTHASEAKTIVLTWEPRPLVQQPNGTSACQPSLNVNPPRPTIYNPKTKADGGGVRG